MKTAAHGGVFFDLGFLKFLQLIFPPTYYLKGIYENSYFLYMICFSGVLFLGLLGIRKKNIVFNL